jgi:hypothetical protein
MSNTYVDSNKLFKQLNNRQLNSNNLKIDKLFKHSVIQLSICKMMIKSLSPCAVVKIKQVHERKVLRTIRLLKRLIKIRYCFGFIAVLYSGSGNIIK